MNSFGVKIKAKLLSLPIIFQLILIESLILSAAFLVANFSLIPDEHNWTLAGYDFYQAIIHLRPDQTFVVAVSPRLGVTVLWISSIIYWWFGRLPFESLIIIHRLVFAIINLNLLLLALWLLRKWASTSLLISLAAYLLLSRYYPLIGRSTWLDQILTSLGFLSVIFWIRYLQFKSLPALVLTGILAGLCMLTKYAGLFFPGVIIILTAYYTSRHPNEWRRLVPALVGTLSISLVTFFVLYPAMWVEGELALFARVGDNKSLVKNLADSFDYLKELRLLDPIILVGTGLLFLDRQKKTPIYLLGLGGLSYLLFYLLIIIILIITARLNFQFLEGIYRYTLPSLPLLTLYTFLRLPDYLKTPNQHRLALVWLFTWEIIFSPYLILGRV